MRSTTALTTALVNQIITKIMNKYDVNMSYARGVFYRALMSYSVIDKIIAESALIMKDDEVHIQHNQKRNQHKVNRHNKKYKKAVKNHENN